MRVLLVVTLALALGLAGCSIQDPAPSSGTTATQDSPTTPSTYQDMGFDGSHWPSLAGTTLTILDHGAFGAFEEAKKRFENKTGARVIHVAANDAGSALQRAVLEKGDPTFDVIYGIDNILYAKAVGEDIFDSYKPLLARDIDPQLVFFGAEETWHATPVDHGYVGLNVDTHAASLAGVEVTSLDDVRDHADEFVTQDPRTSTPGLGFLLVTIATYPEDAAYTWKAYWRDLFAGGVLVTSGWTEAYEQHFSGGYGAEYGAADRAIVTSYTESPAYEQFFGRPADKLATPLLAPNATFHQIQTMGIAKGAKNLAAAQAWIEFSLTDEFQELAAPNGVYPVTKNVSVEDTYGGHDPAPGTFQPAAFDADTLGKDVERWVREWTELCEAADCA